MYLDQFKRGWSYTSVYLLRDRTDEGGNQAFGFYGRDYKPRKAAVYLHDLTTILADPGTPVEAGSLVYTITAPPATVHDMLLQRSDGGISIDHLGRASDRRRSYNDSLRRPSTR